MPKPGKYKVTFLDFFHAENEEEAYDKLLDYLRDVVNSQDVTAFDFLKLENQTTTELTKHIQEIAEESGVDLDAEVHTSESTHTHKGHTIRLSYNENDCHWEAWIKGIGTCVDHGDDQALAAAIKRIDEITA